MYQLLGREVTNRSLRKRVIAKDPNRERAHSRGYLGGRECKPNMAESGVGCFSRVKTAQNSKTEGGIERKIMKM